MDDAVHYALGTRVFAHPLVSLIYQVLRAEDAHVQISMCLTKSRHASKEAADSVIPYRESMTGKVLMLAPRFFKDCPPDLDARIPSDVVSSLLHESATYEIRTAAGRVRCSRLASATVLFGAAANPIVFLQEYGITKLSNQLTLL